MSRDRRRFLLAGVTGILIAASGPYETFRNFPWPVFVALVPLLAAMEGSPPGRRALLAAGAYMLAGGLSQFWLSHFSWFLFLLLLLSMGLVAAGFGWAYQRCHESRLSLFLVPALWTSMELLRQVGLFKYSAMQLGSLLYLLLPLIQIASVTGTLGLSFLVALVNYALFRSLRSKTPWPAMTGLLVVAALVLYGKHVLSTPLPAKGTLPVLLVQYSSPRIRDYGDFDGFLAQTMENRIPREGLVVWPEEAIPLSPDRLARLQELALAHHASFLFGALEPAGSGPEKHLFNSGFLLSPTLPPQVYRKTLLIPFAEHIPFDLHRRFPILERLRTKEAYLTVARHPALLSVPTAVGNSPIGVYICFEAIFGEEVRRRVRLGARLLVEISSDDWSKSSTCLHQQATLSLFRAVELGRDLIRTSDVGITYIATARGEVRDHTEPFIDRNVSGGVTLYGGETIFARFGDWFAWGCLGSVGVALVGARFRRRRG